MTAFGYPFYSHPCDIQEDHARHIVVHQYVACIRVPNVWAVPESSVWLEVPALVDALVGSCIWNPDYGYFLITAYDKEAQKILVERLNVSGTALPGVVIPLCTKFIFTARPYGV